MPHDAEHFEAMCREIRAFLKGVQMELDAIKKALPSYQEYVSIRFAAEHTGFSVSTVRDWSDRGIVRSKKIDGTPRKVHLADVCQQAAMGRAA